MDKFIENKRTRKQIKENEKKKNNIKEDNCQVKFFKQKQLLLLYFVRFSSYCAILRTVYILFLSDAISFFFPRLHCWKSILSRAIQEGLHPLDVSIYNVLLVVEFGRRSFLLFLLSVLLYFVLFVRDRFFKRLLNSR